GGTLTLNTNALGTGNGGTVSVLVLGAGSDLTVGSATGNLVINARGGSASSLSGNGANVTLTAGHTLTVNAGSLNAAPQGTNGNGAPLTLPSAWSGVGNLVVNGNLSANGVGTGTGGTINVTYGDATNPFVVGTAVTNSGVTGNISADAGGSGLGGAV